MEINIAIKPKVFKEKRIQRRLKFRNLRIYNIFGIYFSINIAQLENLKEHCYEMSECGGGGKVDVLVMDVFPKRNVEKALKELGMKKILYQLR